ncbi:MAG: factor activating pos9 [Ramalina farinacea]|uniref:Adenylate kinase isoenzyme 6 homolog n=1 Tax=Ramalina farinacea TaxID=258253 RepID=A0AA43QVM3_9LECA|nr:factor activating pos9 [Ramalina farinacea]
MPRKQPNIVVTGTPGVGKTSHCELLTSSTGLTHLSMNTIVKEKGCHEGWDEEYQSYTVDEDKLLDVLEDSYDVPTTGGYILDWHACDIFPESWIDLVVVLRTDSTKLYDRLKARKYSERKLQENLDSEIMEVLLQEAREGFPGEGMVVELRSDEADEIEGNVQRITEWVSKWKEDREVQDDDDGD